MKDIINSFKLVKYSIQFKGSLAAGIIFFVVGILFELTGSQMSSLTGLYLGVAATFVVNLFLLSQVPGIARASRLSYITATQASSIALFIYSMVAFTLFVTIRLNLSIPRLMKNDEKPYYMQNESMYMDIMKTAFFLALLMIYTAISFRRYIVSLVLIFIGLLVYMYINRLRPVAEFEVSLCREMQAFAGDRFIPLLLLISYALILLGVILFWLVNKMLFKYEIEPIVYRNAMKRAYADR